MDKLKKLKDSLKRLRRVVVAYSGGLDSTFLLKIAVDTLGKENVLAVSARSETYPDSEYRAARRLAKSIGARHLTIRTRELEIANFKRNPVNRCYYCKRELFKRLVAIKKRYGMEYVLDGTNYDDLKDIRYGRIAARELGVRSPLLEAGVTKADIRKFSKCLRLPTWNKPSFACLASRLPFYNDISRKDLTRIGNAEEYLRRSGLKQVRVRLHCDIARIEVSGKDFTKALKLRKSIVARLKNMGFKYISLDLQGYRTGSMHEAMRGGIFMSDAEKRLSWTSPGLKKISNETARLAACSVTGSVASDGCANGGSTSAGNCLSGGSAAGICSPGSTGTCSAGISGL